MTIRQFLRRWVPRAGFRAPWANGGEPHVVLYTRQGCHLCEDARSLLAKYGLRVSAVDIDADPLLRERYTSCVPVVFIDGRERFRGGVNEVLLRRLLSKLGWMAKK